ncbi:hypothetical protein RJ55_05789 [Drechmeria coniospora]|nr:hypothetical protein RJ55_05789 [Drechmeria coniospora]
MVDAQQYISPTLPQIGISTDALSLSAGARKSSACSHYSSVSSFGIPTQCDPNLLTPTSGGSSPPLLQPRELMEQYPPPPGSPGSQEPTPPGSSRMYQQWNNHFEMHEQPSSSMDAPANAASSFYLDDVRRTPGPPEPYMGSYGVSESGTDPVQIHSGASPYYLDGSHMGGHKLMTNHAAVDVDLHRGPGGGRLLPSSCTLLSSHSTPPQHMSRVSTDSVGPRGDNAPPARSLSGSPGRSSAGVGKARKSRASRRQTGLPRRHEELDPSREHKNCHGEEVPPSLHSTCPDELRCIFESRWRHRNQRGHDMWNSIQTDFFNKFHKAHGKEMLQMKFKRARSKYIKWLPKDEEILHEAWKRMERERYQTLLDVFFEMGGSRNMRLSASDIEVKVVNDLRLEEHFYMDDPHDLGIRRRRRLSKLRSNGTQLDTLGEMMMIGSRVPHNEDAVINKVHERRDGMRWGVDPAMPSELMGMTWESRAPMRLDPPPPLASRLVPNGGLSNRAFSILK